MVRKCVAEFLGVFAIVFFGCGSIATLHGDPGSHLMVNAVFGLVVAASIYALGHISAAHFNPAVTIGFATARHFPWRQVPGYVGAQFAGGLLASGLHRWLFVEKARAASFGVTTTSLDMGRALGVEVLLTFFLMLVIASVATDGRVHGAVAGLAIGMAVTACGLFGGPLTGCSMNPARSLGPALFEGGNALSQLGLYVAGPVIGAVLAAKTYEAIRGEAQPG